MDPFTIPPLTEGTFRVCTVLTSATDGTEASRESTAAPEQVGAWGDAEAAVRVPVELGGCVPGPRQPPTPASVRLPGPIGERTVLDTWCMGSMVPSSGDCPSDGSAPRWPTPR